MTNPDPLLRPSIREIAKELKEDRLESFPDVMDIDDGSPVSSRSRSPPPPPAPSPPPPPAPSPPPREPSPRPAPGPSSPSPEKVPTPLPDWYELARAREVLGVPNDATEKQIKSAYRSLSLQYHPDKNPPARKREFEEVMKMISNAYDTYKRHWSGIANTRT